MGRCSSGIFAEDWDSPQGNQSLPPSNERESGAIEWYFRGNDLKDAIWETDKAMGSLS